MKVPSTIGIPDGNVLKVKGSAKKYLLLFNLPMINACFALFSTFSTFSMSFEIYGGIDAPDMIQISSSATASNGSRKL